MSSSQLAIEEVNAKLIATPGRLVDGVRLVTRPQLQWMLKFWGEYSCSMPTGTWAGKRWLRNRNAFWHETHPGGANPQPEPEWLMGEYVPDAEPGYVRVVWTPVRLDPEFLAQEETRLASEVESILGSVEE